MRTDYRRRYWRIGFNRPTRRLFWSSPAVVRAWHYSRTGKHITAVVLMGIAKQIIDLEDE